MAAGFVGSVTSTSTSSGAAGLATAGAITNNGMSSAVPTSTVVGSVFGGVAGLAILLLAALVLLRWWKRSHYSSLHAVTEAAATTTTPSAPAGESSGLASGAASAAVAAAAGFARRLSRSRNIAPTAGGAVGFERMSGRKLPSQFSPGMEGPSRDVPSGWPLYPSGSTAYPSGGTYYSAAITDSENPFADPIRPETPLAATAAGAAAASAARRESGTQSEREMIMPGPARTPILHQAELGRASYLAAPASPTFGAGAAPRLVTPPRSNRRPYPSSFEGSARESRFTEDVT